MTTSQFSPKLRILNVAANLIGAHPIEDPETAHTGAAQILVSHYQQSVDEILELRDWHCAVKRIKLLPSAAIDRELHDGRYGYFLPQDFITFADMNVCDPNKYIEAGHLFLNTSAAVKLRYVSRDTEALWTPALTRLIGIHLAMSCSFARKESASAARNLRDDYFTQLRKATALEGRRSSHHILEDERGISGQGRR